jgi:hypothetical protein
MSLREYLIDKMHCMRYGVKIHKKEGDELFRLLISCVSYRYLHASMLCKVSNTTIYNNTLHL